MHTDINVDDSNIPPSPPHQIAENGLKKIMNSNVTRYGSKIPNLIVKKREKVCVCSSIANENIGSAVCHESPNQTETK